MKKIYKIRLSRLLLLVIVISLYSCNSKSDYINPTGSYELDSKSYMKEGDKYGRFGEVQIKELPHNKVVMTFYNCIGAPSYNSGSFVDTLAYKDNTIIFTEPEYDPGCEIRFTFSDSGIVAVEKTEDYNGGCGFGHGVFADGFYKRISSKEPILKYPMSDKLLK
jgi:site-specific DNA-adenine methylase